MSIQRFHAPTAREALAKARAAFGEEAIILSNKPTAQGGVEVVATNPTTLAALDKAADNAMTAEDSVESSTFGFLSRRKANAEKAAKEAARAARGMREEPEGDVPEPAERAERAARAALRASPRSTVEEDADQLAMSTLSFQDYVRERVLQRRHEVRQHEARQAAQTAQGGTAINVGGAAPRTYAVVPPDQPVQAPRRVAVPEVAPATTVPEGLMHELNAMKDLIEERFSTLAWLGQAKQNPVRANLTLKLIRAGYSPNLARAALEKMPNDTTPAEAMRWMLAVLERNLKTDKNEPALHEAGGIYALVGATGVGKTTTAAKLAAQCARDFGPASVGLITLDSYRIGAHEQLRTYGRMLGVVAHMAHDQSALQDLLGLLSNRKMVIIDTTGVAPRDPRKREVLDMLDLPGVQRLMVLNAANHGDAQDEAVASFRSSGAQHAVLTKTDEAVKLGPTLDAAIRHRLVLRGVSCGQRVPEDWARADAEQLVKLSMRSTGRSAHDPQLGDLDLYFTQMEGRAQSVQGLATVQQPVPPAVRRPGPAHGGNLHA
ncbi:flagellar biosynthesis protein FlhF [Hylemonella sp. W303a]|uniref:flagellar biosynthesis protein FlhF n=1 Tax=Hylemonella sp. W303a TaxID=3389873 RepID=UPI00396B0597